MTKWLTLLLGKFNLTGVFQNYIYTWGGKKSYENQRKLSSLKYSIEKLFFCMRTESFVWSTTLTYFTAHWVVPPCIAYFSNLGTVFDSSLSFAFMVNPLPNVVSSTSKVHFELVKFHLHYCYLLPRHNP